MAAAVDVVSSSGVRRKVRAFIDQSSQASFVTSNLVGSLEAPQTGEVNLSIQGFSGKTDTAQTSVHELRVIDCSGTYHVLNVIKRKALNLDIPTISADAIQRWRDHGIEVSGHEGKCDSENIQVLIGADFANKFMHDKKEVELRWSCLAN